MIRDLEELPDDDLPVFDTCLVGAGPAGISIANELIGSGLKVCLAESGGYADEPETQALYQGDCIGHPMPLEIGRYRVFGGSATKWGGRSATLDPIDFEHRDWVANSGWPISFGDMLPYYERAKQASNFKRPWLDDDAVLTAIGIDLPKLPSDDIVAFVWRFASPDLKKTIRTYATLGYRHAFDWRTAYRKRLQADPDTLVILHANMIAMRATADGARVGAITVSSMRGRTLPVRAASFVLCCGGIENTRLLLHAPPVLLARINEFDNVGRYLSQHPRGIIASIETSCAGARALQQTFNKFERPSRIDVQYETGLALSERTQRKHRLLNASVGMYYHAPEHSSWHAGRRLRDGLRQRALYPEWYRDVVSLMTNMGADMPNATRKFVTGRELIFRRPTIKAVIDLEQAPNRHSRVSLSAKRDALGMHQPEVDWRISDLEVVTARAFAGFVKRNFESLGLGRVRAADWLAGNRPSTGDELTGNYHHIGTTRMSASPRDGVVDADCRVHGVENLYTMGASVFPTGGHANPTLTIVALAIRLADHIRGR